MIATRGMRTAFRAITQSSGGRSIHIPSNLGRRPVPKSAASAKDFVQQARQIINRLLFGGTAASSNSSQHFARSFHSIRSQLSLPARHALTNPLGSPFLPKPAALRRSITQVGLGTARNFGTARPIFQAIAENVPITARAAYEMDWDVERKRSKLRSSSKKLRSVTKVPKTKKLSKSQLQKDFEHYFAEPLTSDVSTHLTVPLVPSGAENIVPSIEGTSKGYIVPRKAVSDAHAIHSKHAARVNTLFLRLDQAKVWERGAHYEAFGVSDESGHIHPEATAATCTTLNIVFDGWTRQMVLDVIGEAGKGWCVLKETYTPPKDAPKSVDNSLATLSSEASAFLSQEHEHEFIMPTLDFSSSFLAYHSPEPVATSRSHSPFLTFNDMTVPSSPPYDNISIRSLSDHESDDDQWHWSRTPSSASEYGGSSPRSEPKKLPRSLEFSADFISRGQEYMNPF